MSARLPAHPAVVAGSAIAVALAAHTAVNLRQLRRPDPHAPEVSEPVCVLIPARDEVAHVEATVRSVLGQTGVPGLSVIVLDDGSTDGTGAVLDRVAAEDRRVTVIHADTEPPLGWLGKPWACQRLSEHASAGVLVFVDADVVLEPWAVRAAVHELRTARLAMIAPYPRQLALTWLERLVQPLVTWSWAATMPVAAAERSARPSLSAANGQFLVVDAEAYRAAGGHAAVRGEVLEDIALMRAFKMHGRHCATVDGSHLASCRMYDGTDAVIDGYSKSLWAAFGGPVGSIAVNAALIGAYALPATAAIAARRPGTRAVGVLGYAAGVASRGMVARRAGEPLVDSLAQPASITAFVALNAVSWSRHLRGANRWKGRAVVPVDHADASPGSASGTSP